MFDLLGNLVQVDTDGLALTDGTPQRQIPLGWCETMTEADWADYGRARLAETAAEAEAAHRQIQGEMEGAAKHWGSSETRGDWT